MEIYDADDFDVKVKSDASPVTEADEAADALISAGLRAAFPEMLLVTEEQAVTHGAAGDTFLIVDPLDGTKEFIHRRGDFTVNIALVENGVPTRGVVYAPAKGRMFYTLPDGTSVEEPGRSTGAHRRDAPICGLAPRQRRADGGGLASRTAIRRPTTISRKYAVRDMTSAGSSLKFCLVATGEADLYPRVGRTMEWDTAAGHAVLAGAGGQVVRFDDHTPLTLRQAGLCQPVLHRLRPGRRAEGGLMSVLIVIPARYASTRYPGKPLVPLTGATGRGAHA